MSKILQEVEVTLQNLGEHLENAGWDVEPKENRLVLHTTKGIGFVIRLDEARQFINIWTHLPIRKDYTDGLDLVNTLNSDVFLACFNIDSDNDLIVTYQMSYERGLILAQLARIVRRFGSLLEHVMDTYDGDRVFALSPKSEVTVTEPRPTIQ